MHADAIQAIASSFNERQVKLPIPWVNRCNPRQPARFLSQTVCLGQQTFQKTVAGSKCPVMNLLS